MLRNLFRDKKNERVGLLLAAVIFGLVALVQLWRGFTGVPVDFGGHVIPIWPSFLVGALALLMCFWMALILRRNRPLL